MALQDKNELYGFIENTLMNDFVQLARVNIVNGDFQFLKVSPNINVDPNGFSNIFDYAEQIAKSKYISADYEDGYLRFIDPDTIRRRVFGGERRIVYRYKRTDGKWDVFSITSPKDCSPENPWTVFSIMNSDAGSTALTEAMTTLSVIYYKILKINLTTDSYEIIKTDGSEHLDNKIHKITEWLEMFASIGNVHEEDLDVYKNFTDTEKIKEHFRTTKTRISCRYRRKQKTGGYRWAQMDIVAGEGYSDDNVKLLLFVKDVHEEHMSELRHREELVDNFNRDALTLLYNRNTFNDDVDRIRKGSAKTVTCLYVDANGLHEINNALGHQKGDDMLCCVADTLKSFFPDDRVYRIGGDEYVMLSKHLTSEEVTAKAKEVNKKLAQLNYAISVGVESGQSADISKVVDKAEQAMRLNKEEYYKGFDKDRKKRERNEELEKMLTEKRDEEYFLGLIGEMYAGVYFIDIKRDSLRHIFIPEYFKGLLEEASFSVSKALTMYANKFVESKFIDGFCELLNFEELAKMLDTKESIDYLYRKKNGMLMELKILRTNTVSDGKEETIWIFKNAE